MQSSEQEKDKAPNANDEEQKSEGSDMKRILLGRSETGDSALNRLKKPWPKAMEADDEEGRHRLVLGKEDGEKKEEEEAAGADSKEVVKDDDSKKTVPSGSGPAKLPGFADPKPVGTSPVKKVEPVAVKEDASKTEEAKPATTKEEPKKKVPEVKEEPKEVVMKKATAGFAPAAAPIAAPTPIGTSASVSTHSDEDNDAAEALKAIMQLGTRPFSSVAAAAKSSSPSKSTGKKSLPTKRSRDADGSPGASPVAPGMGKDGKAKKTKQQGPPIKKRKVPPGGAKEGKKAGKSEGKVKKIKGEGKKKVKGEKARKPQALPEILMDLLNKNISPDAIFWLPGQQIFLINKENFKKKVIPKYFNGKTFTSITKSLNLWNFTKAPKAQLPPNTVGYHHKLFQKDAPHLLKQMVDGGGAGDPNSKNNEANSAPGALSAAAKKTQEADGAELPKAALGSPNSQMQQPMAAAAAGLATLGELAASAAPAAALQAHQGQLDPQQAELEALQSRSLQLAAEREALMQSMLGQQQGGLGGGGSEAAALELFRQRQAMSQGGEYGGLSELDLLRERAAAGGDTATLELLRQQQQQQDGGDHASFFELAEHQRNSAMERAIAERMMLEREMYGGGGGFGGGDPFSMQLAQLRAQQGGGIDPMMMLALRQRQAGGGANDQSTLELLRQRQQDEAALEAENALAEQQRNAAMERLLLERELGSLGGGGQQQQDFAQQLAQLRGQGGTGGGGAGAGGGGVDPMMLLALRQQQDARNNNALEELMLLEQQRRQQDALRAFMFQRGGGGGM